MKPNTERIVKKSKDIRVDVVKMVSAADASHVGSALSCIDILTCLYFGILNVDPKKPYMESRDKFILSKGHAGVGLLATLAHRGFFKVSKLNNYCSDGSTLTGHTMIESVPGVEATTGSLGHGLPLGIGMSVAAKRNKNKSLAYVLLSDGELDEGSNWEAILAAGNFKLDNLVAIVDYNKIQSFGTVREIMDLEPLRKKWADFKWSVVEVDGHDIAQLVHTFGKLPFEKGKPSCIIAHTIKGKGVSFMENKLEWHYKSPKGEQLIQALDELR